jgi:hypothetical protein
LDGVSKTFFAAPHVTFAEEVGAGRDRIVVLDNAEEAGSSGCSGDQEDRTTADNRPAPTDRAMGHLRVLHAGRSAAATSSMVICHSRSVEPYRPKR